MRQLLPCIFAAALAASVAAGEIYRWTDGNGVVHYGDKPPATNPSGAAQKLDDGAGAGFSVMTTIEAPPEEPGARSAARKRARRTFSTWYEDGSGYESALRQQKRTEAPLLVYFRTDWCPHCRRLDAMLGDPEVERYLAQFVRVRINPEHGQAEDAIFRKYGGNGYPSLYLHAATGSTPVKMSAGGPSGTFVQRFRDIVGDG
ncbi:MAG: DUF4124 domain-containing protein [Candidatus Binatia bacterium]